MRKSIVVAMDLNNGIGFQNRLPWHLPSELQIFMTLTLGHHLIMGRKTYESIGKPLEGRTNILVTRNTEYQFEGCLIANSVATALALAESNGESEAFIGGGTGIFRDALPDTDRLYLSRIHAEFQVDTYFPEFDMTRWTQISKKYHPVDEKNPYPFTFFICDKETQDV